MKEALTFGPKEPEASKLASQRTTERVLRGETVIFVYPFANPERVDEIMRATGAKGQFDLGLYADSLLHVTIPKAA